MQVTSGRSDDRRWCAGLFVLAWALRLAHLLTVRNSEIFSRLMLDSQHYDAWGRQIAGGAWIGSGAFFQDPLYAYALGVLHAVGWASPAVIAAIQGLLGALVAPLVYVAARLAFDRTAARSAGLLAATLVPSIYYEGLVLKTSLSVFLVAVALALLARAATRATDLPAWFGAGLTLGLAAMTRGNLLIALPAVALAACFGGTDLPAGRVSRAPWRAALVLIVGGLAPVALTALHNGAASGEFILTTANAGQNFYIGNNAANRDGDYARLSFVDPDPQNEQIDFQREAERRVGRQLSAREVSSVWWREALSWIRANPGEWMRLCWRKLRALTGAHEIPDSYDFDHYRQSAPVLRWPFLPGFGLLTPLGLLGGLLALRRRGFSRLALAFMTSYVLSVVAFFVLARFRLELVPPLCIFAGLALSELVGRLRAARRPEARRAPLVAWAVALVALWGWVNLPVRGPADSWRYRAARAVGLPSMATHSATAHYNLGVTYAAEASTAADPAERLRRAENELKKAAEAEPDRAQIWSELGKVLARQRQDAAAVDALGRAVELEPSDWRTYHALGLLARRLGDLSAAERAFRAALSVVPRHAPSAARLGEVLAAQGRFTEAVEAFRLALQIDPGQAAAIRGLEEAMNALRDIDVAPRVDASASPRSP